MIETNKDKKHTPERRNYNYTRHIPERRKKNRSEKK